MAKNKLIYTCNQCGAQFPKWAGQCTECGAWNCIVEEVFTISNNLRTAKFNGFMGETSNKVTLLSEVKLETEARISTASLELDRVLGGGLVSGSVVLIGGDPGIGKSTLLLQTLCRMLPSVENSHALYVTGEESLQQVTLRARRLGLPENQVKLLADTQVETILTAAQNEKPNVMVIDSIQTMYTDALSSAPGAVSQVRESAAQLVQFAKKTGIALFIIGHVTREGTIAGPRVLEHMVDTVLYFEGDHNGRFRVIRAVKNRFGAVNELGVFAMTDKGLKEVNNPSAIFLSRYEKPIPGSVVMVTWEGTRPMLVEIQALVDESHLANPRRVTVGMEQNRLAMLLAILHRHCGIATFDQDVFVNVVGGVKVIETGIDLAILLSVISSLKNKPFPADWFVFGEVGLAGEIRPVQSGQERLKEAEKHGFKKAIVPKSNAPKHYAGNLEVVAVQRIEDILNLF